MSEQTRYTLWMDEVARYTQTYLRPLGFRKFRRTYNRRIQADFVQIIEFQMVPSTSAAYPAFSVNLSVFVPQAVQLLQGQSASSYFLYEPDGLFRTRLSDLMPPTWSTWRGEQYYIPKTGWWSLGADTLSISEEIIDVLQLYAEPYLNQRKDVEAVHRTWQQELSDDSRWHHRTVIRDFTTTLFVGGYEAVVQQHLQDLYAYYRSHDPDNLAFLFKHAQILGIQIEKDNS